MKKLFVVLFCAALILQAAWAEETETIVQLSDKQILVNGVPISEDTAQDVFLAQRIEAHDDVPEELKDLSNRVVTIAAAGTYRFSGTANDTQISVKAGEDDEVCIILDKVDISCRTAPAIAVHTAKDPRIAGEYAVTIELAEGSVNNVTGSHTEKMWEEDVKLSGAITSLTSIGFDGEGYLIVDGDNEGIEAKFGHMTFDGGNIIVTSGDDPLNASEDGVSVITVNDGTLHLNVRPDKGGEGDGMDSNGTIVINGGLVDSYSHPDSMDSGIDSDLGCTINGGIVLGVGNMYDEISAQSGQLFMALQFAEKVEDMIVLTTMDGEFVAFIEASAGYTSYVLSSPDIPEGDYFLYLGGELEVQDGEVVYTPGTQLQHGGSIGGKMGRGGMQRPDDMPELPKNMEKPADMPVLPEGMRWHDRQMPEGFERVLNGGMQHFGDTVMNSEVSTTFHLAPGSTMFTGITAAK